MSNTSSPHINQLRTSLMATLERLGDLGRDANTLTADQIKNHVSLANAQKAVADSLIETAKVENEYLKITLKDHSAFLAQPPNPLPPQVSGPSAHNPFPTSVTHRLEG